MIVDFSLLVSVLILSEALLHSYKQQKVLMKFLHFVIINRVKVGKPKLIQWLRTTDFKYTDELEQILKTTPLGNPAWSLFGDNPDLTSQLIEDLEKYISNTSSQNPKSLKSLIKDFVKLHPQYGTVPNPDPDEWTTFRRGSQVSRNILGDVITQLILLQMAATPKSRRQLIAEAKATNPDGLIKVEKDNFPIHRPDAALYEIAIRDLLIGTAEVSSDAWEEMVGLYMSKYLTNFLAFAPLLLQPFAKSTMNIPVPNINTLATLMGNFTGATGTFMGEITRSKKTVRWETLGLTIGKLCEKTERLPEVSLHEKKEKEETKKLYGSLEAITRICGDISHMTETPQLGEDRGHVLIQEELLKERWNINLTDINDSIISDKIDFKKFPKVKGSLVFTSSKVLTRLDHWNRKQMKQRSVSQLQAVSGGSFKLPSTRDLATSSFSVLPLFTYTFRLEKKSQNCSVERKSHPKVEAKTKMYLGCEVSSDFPNDTLDVCKRVGLSEQADSERNTTFTNKPPSVPDDGISRFFIAETYKEDRLKKEQVIKLRHQRFLTLKEEAERKAASSQVRTMSYEELKATITDKLEKFKAATSKKERLRPSHCDDLEEAFAELIRRDLGFELPIGPGFALAGEQLHFRYFLGDEEAVAIETWHKRNPKIPTSKAVRRIWVALTYIWITRHLTSEGKQWTEKDLWKSDDYFNYPLIEEDEHSVYSLIPYLYWTCYLGEPDIFRKHDPDMKTALFVPTARISNFEDLSPEDKEDKPGFALYPNLLPNVRVSSLSLCSFHDWSPDDILKSAMSFFNIKYSPDLHPDKTKYIRLYVKIGVETMLRRFSNKNLAHILSYVSPIRAQLPAEDVWELFASFREKLRDWYYDFVNAFCRKWTVTLTHQSDMEWMQLEELTTHDVTYDENGFVLHL